MICCVCGEKQRGLLSDYPLSETMQNERVCGACSGALEIESWHPDRTEHIEYLCDMLNSNNTMKPDVRTYVQHRVEELEKGEAQRKAEAVEQENREARLRKLPVTSGYDFQGYRITKYHDFMSTEVVLGMGIFKAMEASLANLTGDESDSLSKKAEEARKTVIGRLKRKVVEAGANAIIGIDIDYTMFGDSIIAVIASGTAVTIEKCVE